jgi:hypothetical protein
MVMGVAMVNKTLAWEKWMQSSLANEASLHPTFWPGVWTAADYISTGIGKETRPFAPFIYKIVLPRQARDKHRENSKKRVACP